MKIRFLITALVATTTLACITVVKNPVTCPYAAAADAAGKSKKACCKKGESGSACPIHAQKAGDGAAQSEVTPESQPPSEPQSEQAKPNR